MNYRDNWDLSTIPDPKLYAEVGRRRGRNREYTTKCACGQCQTCKKRERMRTYRAKKS